MLARYLAPWNKDVFYSLLYNSYVWPQDYLLDVSQSGLCCFCEVPFWDVPFSSFLLVVT